MTDNLARLVVNVSSDGTVSAETIGVKGESCLNVIGILEEILSATTIESAFTAEYFEQENVNQEAVSNVVEHHE